MAQPESIRFKAAWVALAVEGLAVLGFGLAAVVWPGSSDAPYLQAIGAAAIGMGLFGILIATIPLRRRERWAWLALWYYPVFWTAHWLGGLPPGQDHIHQILFIVLSIASLLASINEIFPQGAGRARPNNP